jgi:hypothetical protein
MGPTYHPFPFLFSPATSPLPPATLLHRRSLLWPVRLSLPPSSDSLHGERLQGACDNQGHLGWRVRGWLHWRALVRGVCPRRQPDSSPSVGFCSIPRSWSFYVSSHIRFAAYPPLPLVVQPDEVHLPLSQPPVDLRHVATSIYGGALWQDGGNTRAPQQLQRCRPPSPVP